MGYLIAIVILVLIYIILATSLDIVFSNAGIFSVSHAAFFGIGALIYAVLSKLGHVNYFLIIRNRHRGDELDGHSYCHQHFKNKGRLFHHRIFWLPNDRL